jgi:hypothetical protein
VVHLVRRSCESRRFHAEEVGLIGRDAADGWFSVEFGHEDLVELHLATGAEPTSTVLPGEPGAYVVSCARR